MIYELALLNFRRFRPLPKKQTNMFCVNNKKWDEIIEHIFAATLAQSNTEDTRMDVLEIVDQMYLDMQTFRTISKIREYAMRKK